MKVDVLLAKLLKIDADTMTVSSGCETKIFFTIVFLSKVLLRFYPFSASATDSSVPANNAKGAISRVQRYKKNGTYNPFFLKKMLQAL